MMTNNMKMMNDMELDNVTGGAYALEDVVDAISAAFDAVADFAENHRLRTDSMRLRTDSMRLRTDSIRLRTDSIRLRTDSIK